VASPWQCIQVVQAVNVERSPAVATVKLTKTGGVGGTWDAGASGVETIAGDGFVEFTPTDTAKAWAVGLSDVDTNVNYTTIDYGFLFANAAATFEIVENGVTKTAPAAYAAGNVFRVEKRDGGIAYFRNGEMVNVSNVSSLVAVRVDASFNTAASTVDGVRFYDGTTLAWKTITWQGVAGVTAALGAAATMRRLSIPTPSKIQPGHQIVVIIASQGWAFVSSTNVAWTHIEVVGSGTHRSFRTYRRRAVDGEPTSYTFDLVATQETLGVVLIYRNTDDALPRVAASADDIFNATVWPCPKRTLTRYSDLYLGLALQLPVAGTMTVPGDATQRANFSQSTFGIYTPRLVVFDFAAENTGATDFKRITASVASSGAAASIALPGMPARGLDLGWNPVVTGAIGLPKDGI
jgi:hypothetical protein